MWHPPKWDHDLKHHNLMRKTGLSQKALYAILRGQPVRQPTLAIFKRGTADPKAEKCH